MNNLKKRLLYAIIALLSIAIDQIVKHWARVDLALRPGSTIPLIEGVFHLTYVENRGAAFGILQNQRWLFLVLTVAVTAAIAYILFIRKKPLPMFAGIALSFTLGGALGNFIDRLLNGYVVDVFDFRLIGFAVFNVADMCLVCSVIVLAIWLIYTDFIKKKEVPKDEVAKNGSE